MPVEFRLARGAGGFILVLRRAAVAPGPKVRRFERPRAVRRSRPDVLLIPGLPADHRWRRSAATSVRSVFVQGFGRGSWCRGFESVSRVVHAYAGPMASDAPRPDVREGSNRGDTGAEGPDELRDAALHEEIELVGQVVVAPTSTPHRLSQREIDQVLGVDEGR
jgi:hypothetical protein